MIEGIINFFLEMFTQMFADTVGDKFFRRPGTRAQSVVQREERPGESGREESAS